MARERLEEPGAIHHVFARGVNRQPIFVEDEDFELYVRLLGDVVTDRGWLCLGFCLMPNHVHILVQTPEPNLGAGMQFLQSRYARAFNERRDRVGEGHVFQGPYGSKRVTSDLYLLRVAAYLAANPVTAGLCKAPAEWPWSSEGFAARNIKLEWMRSELLHDRLYAITGRSDFVAKIVM